jgi:CPA2 family monovalent cation:H+ antiporter-2
MVIADTLPFLNDLVVLFAVSVVIAYLCYRFRLVPIVGFLIAGVIIGPHALGLVHDLDLVNILAEIGIILLMFTIGIEFSLERLGRIRKAIFVGGGFQVGITTAIVTGILMAIGISWKTGIYTGCLVALSSTAIVLGLLSDQDKTGTPGGQLCLAVLIFQDLATVVIILLLPFLGGQSRNSLSVLWLLGKAVILIVVVLVFAQRVVPWILEKIAQTRRQELFLLTVVAICFGTAALTNMVGVSLSLGAFLGGLVVSESNFREQAISEVLPFRTIFTAVFFVSVGMLLDVKTLIQHPLLIAGTTIVVLVIKFLINTGSMLSLGYPIRIVAASGLAIAQIGEFSFVLERAGRGVGLTPAGLGDLGSQAFIAVSVLLMIASPFLFNAAPHLGYKLSNTRFNRWGGESFTPQPSSSESNLEDHVIIIGYGPAGRHLVKVLSDSGIQFVVIEMNPNSVQEMRKQQIPVIYGDASRIHILQQARVKRAKVCVIATNDPRSTPLILNQARFLNPTIQLIVRTRYLRNVAYLEQKGADIVVPEEMQTTVRLFSHVLNAYMVPQQEIDQYIQKIRKNDYKIMRNSIPRGRPEVLKGLDEEGLHTRTVTVRESSPLSGQTLKDLQLRNRHGITVLAVKRGHQTFNNPAGEFTLAPDDRLVLVADAQQFEISSELFRGTDGEGNSEEA